MLTKGPKVRVTRRATNPDGTKVELRKTSRFPVAVPIEASWLGANGKAVKHDAVARQVNMRGGFLEMSNYPELGTRITLTNFLSAETVEARVLATPNTRAGVSNGIIIELVAPSETFWGVDLQVKKTAVELRKLETSLRNQGIDLRLLKEFRDAVDYIRTAATVAQQLRERQLQGHSEDEVLTLIAAERARRATNLCLEVASDMDAARSSKLPKDVGESYTSLLKACDRLKQLLKRQESERQDSERHSVERNSVERHAATRA
jgi:hypothetical protein